VRGMCGCVFVVLIVWCVWGMCVCVSLFSYACRYVRSCVIVV